MKITRTRKIKIIDLLEAEQYRLKLQIIFTAMQLGLF